LDHPINNISVIGLFTCWFGSLMAYYKTTQVRGQLETKQEEMLDKKIKIVTINLFKVQRPIERNKKAVH
jgi:hypothetical protein